MLKLIREEKPKSYKQTIIHAYVTSYWKLFMYSIDQSGNSLVVLIVNVNILHNLGQAF